LQSRQALLLLCFAIILFLAAVNKIVEQQTWTMKLVSILIRVGIIPLYVDKNGQFFIQIIFMEDHGLFAS